MKYCPNCGNEIPENTNFCPRCGRGVGVGNSQTSMNNTSYVKPNIKERNIALCIIYSIITCGIYGLYWFVCMTDEANSVGESKTASGGLALIYTILTCGIYMFYWYYMMGKKLYEAGKKYNENIADNSVIYLLLPFIGLSIVSNCLIQNDLNRLANK